MSELNINTIDKNIVFEDIEPDNYTGFDIKELLQDKIGVPPECQLIRYKDEEIEDDKLLSEYDIEDVSYLDVEYILEGGEGNDNICCICFCICIRGGGLGCCPVEEVTFCCPKTDDEKMYIPCSIL
eukprot:TRINITY_DN1253_c0_g1_i1.p1 TRINITY_DN1253_c0_g1~~TRINITY_DN1253_c0_g1_i1.p1  ORF type:complete len:126 (+),score=50.42 TRINITY_DN1253_c0_g1_i1:87-464(+)